MLFACYLVFNLSLYVMDMFLKFILHTSDLIFCNQIQLGLPPMWVFIMPLFYAASTLSILTQSVLSLRLLASASYNSFPLALFWGQQAAAWFFFFKYIFFLWRLFSKLLFPLTIKDNFLFLSTEVVIHRCIFICL